MENEIKQQLTVIINKYQQNNNNNNTLFERSKKHKGCL